MKIRYAIPFTILLLSIQFANRAVAQTPTTATRELTFEEKQKKAIAELPGLVEAWRVERDPAKRERLARSIVYNSRFDGVPNIPDLFYIAMGRSVTPREISIDATSKTLKLSVVKVFTEIPDPQADHGRGWLIRRITRSAIEVWTSREGWLFDGSGKLQNHVVVPRRTGHGLEWFGAFLPDGQWVTTDLWSRDDSLFLYSREGKFIKDITTKAMMPPSFHAATAGMISWARSDGEGKGWVVAVGADGGHDKIWIKPDEYKPLPLKEIEQWKICYRRQLGPRRTAGMMSVPSDDGSRILNNWSPSHGEYIGLAHFEMKLIDKMGHDISGSLDKANGEFEFAVNWGDTGNLGFWPGLHDIFISTGDTWFLDAKGICMGHLKAHHLTDAADGKAMLFKNEENWIIEMGSDLKSREIRVYVAADGKPVVPMALYDDLKLGLFIDGGKLELAGWE